MSTLTIVCVDDERNVLLTLRTQLSRHFPDYAIEITESAIEALELVEELQADGIEIPLVIADQIMPGMKGDALLIELHARYPKMLKVMLTGQARAEDVGNVVNQGELYRFLAKPWHETDLILTVTEALRRYQQDQQLQQQGETLEQANRDLEALNADLEHQVEERRQELQWNELLLRSFHELRHPLNVVTNYARGSVDLSQELMETLQPVLSTAQLAAPGEVQSSLVGLQKNAAAIYTYSQQAQDIIASMLNYGPGDAGKN